MNNSVIVPIKIDAQAYLRYYQGTAKTVQARDLNGYRIEFPANILQKFVSRDGIEGLFRITFDGRGKFLSIEKVAAYPSDRK